MSLQTGNVTLTGGTVAFTTGSNGAYAMDVAAGSTLTINCAQFWPTGGSNQPLQKLGSGTTILTGSYPSASRLEARAGTWIAVNSTSVPSTGAKQVLGGTLATRMGDGTTGWSSVQVNTLWSGATKTSGNWGIDTTNGDVGQWTPFTTTNFGASLGLVKLGSNTLTLNSANTYAGPTTVSVGTLSISSTGSIAGSSGVSVAPGACFSYNSGTGLAVAPTLAGSGLASRAVLGGTGSINAAVVLNNLGDTLSPGNSPGLMPFGANQAWTSFSYDWETNNFTGTTAGTDFDQIAITGGLDLSGGTAYQLNLLSLTSGNVSGLVPGFTETSQSWPILTTTTGISGFDASKWTIDTAGFTSSPAWSGSWSVSQSGNDVVLNYVAVPEPGTLALTGIGAAAAAWAIRRRPLGK